MTIILQSYPSYQKSTGTTTMTQATTNTPKHTTLQAAAAGCETEPRTKRPKWNVI
jgi:hypothetical protein